MWSYSLDEFVDGFRTWAARKDIKPDVTFVWVCAFCNNQYRTLEGSKNLEEVFAPRLRACGRVVMLLNKWNSPLYVTRVWCVFEAWVAQKEGVPLDVTGCAQAVAATMGRRGMIGWLA